jgi:V-type H+-transporting ATPase subunit H
MSFDPPTYLSSLQNNIRDRPIPWDGAVRAGTISEGQLSKIRAVDKVRKEQRKQIVGKDLSGYRTLFVGGDNEKSVFESAAKRADVVQYLLVLLGDLVDGAYQIFCKPALRLRTQIILCLRSKYRHSSSS